MSAAAAEAPALTVEHYVLANPRPELRDAEFQRVMETDGRVRYWRHRAGNPLGAWRHGLPKGVRLDDLRPAAHAAAARPRREAPEGAERPDRLDQRVTAIVPGSLAGIRTSRPAPLPLLPLGEGVTGRQTHHEALYANLPHMGVPATMQTRTRKRPAFLPWHGIPPMLLPDELPHYAAPTPYRTRVAAPGMRLWYEVIMLVPRRERDRVHRIRVRAADLAGWLWPGSDYRPSREGGRLNMALRYLHNCRVPWDGGFWSAVVVKNLPDLENPDTVVMFEVELPPRSQAGPLVYRPVLRHWGAKSAQAWRLCIALAWMWNHYLTADGKILPPRLPIDGAFIRNPLLKKRLPWLGSAELVRLTAGQHPEAMTKHGRYNALLKAQRAIEGLCQREDLVAVWTGDRVRLEPPDGWGKEQWGDKTTRESVENSVL